MTTHPDQFSNFYSSENMGLDIKLLELGYKYYQKYFMGKTCLELGPSTGYMTRLLVNDFEEVYTVEGSKKLLDQVSDFPNLTKVWSLFEDYNPPFLFDTIMLNHVLEHIEKPVELLKRIKNWLAPHGVLIIGVPNAKSFHRLAAVKMGILKSEFQLNQRDHELGHYRVYDFPSLEKDAAEAGFSIKNREGTYLKFLSIAQMEKIMDDKMLEAYIELGKSFAANCAEIILILTH